MKKSAFYIFLFFLFLTAIDPSVAQSLSPITDSTSLQGQYQMMLRKSKTLQDYKLINPYRLSVLWRNATDSLKKEKRKINELQTQLSSQSALITVQKNELASKEQSLTVSKRLVDEVRILGISFNKITYNLIVWGLIFGLIAALIIVIYRSVNYRTEARYRMRLFEELSEEFQTHKVRANEKEKKLARELQDERNKLDDLLKR